MANTTLGNLKIGALRRCGNSYNASDTTGLEIAGGLINDCLGAIQSEVGSSPYFYDLANTVNTTASQAYINTTDTDIIEIVSVYQLTDDTRLVRITEDEYRRLHTDTTKYTGTPDLFYWPTQSLNVSGVNIWSIYFIPTPAAAIAIYFDYIKNIKFATEGAAGDSAFSPFPSVFDELIYAMFRPRFILLTDIENQAAYNAAVIAEQRAKDIYYPMLKQSNREFPQIGSQRAADIVRRIPPVAKTTS